MSGNSSSNGNGLDGPGESHRVILIGGPYDRETRVVPASGPGKMPEMIRIIDAIQTFENVIEATPGEEVPISYQTYYLDSANPLRRLEFGAWRYVYERPSTG